MVEYPKSFSFSFSFGQGLQRKQKCFIPTQSESDWRSEKTKQIESKTNLSKVL